MDPFHPRHLRLSTPTHPLPQGGTDKNIAVKLKLQTLTQLGAILFFAFALKSFYSTASVNDLRWILAPTTFLVELITGKQFVFESRAGYMSADHTFLIAASCSGVNFLIISFLVLAL